MNKIFHYNIGKNNSSCVFIDSDVVPIESENNEKYKDLLDIIFGVDPLTGFPKGDLAIYLGDNANDDIRAFVQQNLLVDNPSVDDSALSMPQELVNTLRGKISDDDIAKFSKNDGESNFEYAERLGKFIEDIRLKNQRERNFQKIRKEILSSSKRSKSENIFDM